MSPVSLLVFDVGNTRVKGAWWNGQSLTSPQYCSTRDQAGLDSFIAALVSAHPKIALPADAANKGEPLRRALISTVAPPLSEMLEQSLTGHQFQTRTLRSDGLLFSSGVIAGDSILPTTGVDRLLSGLAALNRTDKPNVLVVDAGSAITVNAFTAPNRFLGGAILPGFRLMARALTLGTAALPEVRLDAAPTSLAPNTQDALKSGIYAAAVGGVNRLLARLAQEAFAVSGSSDDPKSPAIFVTGGDSRLLATGIELPHQVVDFLVLEGLIHADRVLAPIKQVAV